MMGKRISKIKVGVVWLFILPLSVALIIIFSMQGEKYPQTIRIQEIWDSLPPTTYYDVELKSEGVTQLYHPLDQRTGIFLGPDEEPFTGERNTYNVDTDSVIFTDFITNGKITRSEFPVYDSTGTFLNTTVTIPSIDEDGNLVTTFYDKVDNGLILKSMETISDTLITIFNYYDNGELAMEFQIIPESGLHGLATIYNEQGAIKEQRLYEEGKIVKQIK